MSTSHSITVSGTKEWSVASVNCCDGCEHDCRYCYARWNACHRFHRFPASQWPEMRIRSRDVRRRRRRESGRVMFPSTHDITPAVLDSCCAVIEHVLSAGNDLLIVSKPHATCMARILSEFGRQRSRLVFRFSIGSPDDGVLSYWEPGAPSLAERVDCLEMASHAGVPVGVSCEPLLSPRRAVELYRLLEPLVTDTIWIGKLNGIRSRCVAGTDPSEIARIERGQTRQSVEAVYRELSGARKIRWKESYKSVLGLDQAAKPGLVV